MDRFYIRATLPNARLFIFQRLKYHLITKPEIFTANLSDENKKIVRFAFLQLVSRGVLKETAGYPGEWLPENLNYNLLA